MSAGEQNEETLLEQALAFATAEARHAYLVGACGDDPKLRARVESLVQAHEAAGGFLKDKSATTRVTPDNAAPPEHPGDCIGRYKLLEKLGEGGFGVVYMAEQHEPVRRKVALKIIKVGMDTREVVARFEAERQALALMDHPNIAKIFDAGVTEVSSQKSEVRDPRSERAAANLTSDHCPLPSGSGRPYFVMELVRGVRITDFCDQNQLGLKERLDLFMLVCHAVQHAHQKGIIHRDLKPSNILVTINDGVPVPKVIDFGIAKATQQELTEKTLYTAFGQFMGTPAYMSPEQAVMTSLDIDTRSDIYSLGVLLYELLTGTTPFDAKELLKAGFDEMRRIIRETEPPTPSQRVERMSQLRVERPDAPGVRDRLTLNSQLKLLSTDLDWIVMKCLEKDRARRYETASGLAGDIQRHLRNEPIAARPPSTAYRFQKFFRRNKLAVLAASAVGVALIAGALISIWQAVLAKQERRLAISAQAKAEQSRQRAEGAETAANTARDKAVEEKQRANEQAAVAKAVNDFLQQDLLRQAGSQEQADRGFIAEPNLTLKEALDRAAQQIGSKFKDQPLVEAAVRLAIGNAYRATGAARLAIPHLERAHRLREAKLGPDHASTLNSLHDLAGAYFFAGQLDKALPLLEKTVSGRKKTLGTNDSDTLESMNSLASAYMLAGRIEPGVLMTQETLAKQRERLGPNHPSTLRSMHNLASAYRQLGQIDKALPLFEEILARMNESMGTNHPSTLRALHGLALTYRSAGQIDKAFPLLRETLAKRIELLGRDHPDTLTSMYDLAAAHRDARQFDQALPLFEEALAQRRAKLGSDHSDTMDSINALAVAYHLAGLLEKALPLYEETLAGRKAKYGADHSKTLICMKNLGLAHEDAGHIDQAVATFQTVLDLRRKRYGSGQPETVDAIKDLASALASLGPSDQGIALTHEMLGLQRTLWATNADDLTKALLSGARLLSRFDEFAGAEKLLLEGHDRVPPNRFAGLKLQRDALERLVRLYERWNEKNPGTGKAAQAAEWKQKLNDFDKTAASSKPAGTEP